MQGFALHKATRISKYENVLYGTGIAMEIKTAKNKICKIGYREFLSIFFWL